MTQDTQATPRTQDTQDTRTDRDDLVVNHIPLVHSVANKLNVPHQHEDLVGVGMVALVKTAAKYGPSYGVAFGAYAKRWIRKAMIKHLKRNADKETVPLDDHIHNIGGDGQANRTAILNDLRYYLHPVEEWVVVKRYFEKMRIDDIATELGFETSRVSQIHGNAIRKLRKAFGDTEDAPREEDGNNQDDLLQVVRKMIWDEWGLEVVEL